LLSKAWGPRNASDALACADVMPDAQTCGGASRGTARWDERVPAQACVRERLLALRPTDAASTRSGAPSVS
jgi:hypothetical protein